MELAIDGTTYPFDGKGQIHHCTVAEIVVLNKIKSPDAVPAGTKIKIPQE